MAQSSPLTTASNNNSYQNGNGYYPDANNTTAESDNNGERGRQRKKRDFFGTLKRRLGRSKSRAKSIERSMIPIDADNPNGELRSVSADRMPLGTLGNNIGGGITSNTSTGNYLFFSVFIFIQFIHSPLTNHLPPSITISHYIIFYYFEMFVCVRSSSAPSHRAAHAQIGGTAQLTATAQLLCTCAWKRVRWFTICFVANEEFSIDATRYRERRRNSFSLKTNRRPEK